MMKFASFANGFDVSQISNLNQLRERILKILLMSAALTGTVLYGLAMVSVILKDPSPVVPVIYSGIYLGLLIITFVWRLPYVVRASGMLLFLFIMAVTNLFLIGMNAGAGLFFLAFIAMAALLIGFKGGAVSLALTILTVAGVGYLTVEGNFSQSLVFAINDPMLWLIAGCTLLLMGILVSLSVSALVRNLSANLVKATKLATDLSKVVNELSLTYDATIEGWSRALDLRDKETEGHCQRVTEMTVSLARSLGMTESELVYVRYGALLHDIGKLGVPDNILFKCGPLTEAEFDVIQKHPQYAAEMLSPIAYLQPAMDIPIFHHEKWDGTGYPNGLKGMCIPRAARIFAVVDVWDALTSARPYHAAWRKEDALIYIRENAGKHFDPEVVEVFLRTMN
jgi:putative nucleotidyltransferase with HDIG domain